MSKPTLCVIVPVYKAAATLDRCVASVLAQQVAGIFDHGVLRGGQIVGNIIDTGRAGKGGDHCPYDIIGMDAAENLVRQVDPVRLALAHPVKRGSARSVNARQAKVVHIRPQRLPRQIRLSPRGPPTLADGCAFIHPSTAGIAIDAG